MTFINVMFFSIVIFFFFKKCFNNKKHLITLEISDNNPRKQKNIYDNDKFLNSKNIPSIITNNGNGITDIDFNELYENLRNSSVSNSFLEKDFLKINAIEKAVNWCKNRNINVIFYSENESKYSISERTIYITEKKNKYDKILFTLLHEIGHTIIHDNAKQDISIYERKFNGYVGSASKNKRTFKHKIAVLYEEIEAWNLAEKIAIEDLKINLNLSDFDKEKNSCLKTYVTWVAEK